MSMSDMHQTRKKKSVSTTDDEVVSIRGREDVYSDGLLIGK